MKGHKNPFNTVRLEIDSNGNIKFDPMAGKLLIDQLLEVETPELSAELADLLECDNLFVHFIERITLPNHDSVDSRDSIPQFIQYFERNQLSEEAEVKLAWKAMSMATKSSDFLRNLLKAKEKLYVKSISTIFQSSTRGSLNHFRFNDLTRQLFVSGLNFCPNFAHLLCVEKNPAGIPIILLLLWYLQINLCYVINSPVQDCLHLFFQHIQAKKPVEFQEMIAKELRHIRFMDILTELVLNQENTLISIAAAAQIHQIFQMAGKIPGEHFFSGQILRQDDLAMGLISSITNFKVSPLQRSQNIKIIHSIYTSAEKEQVRSSRFFEIVSHNLLNFFWDSTASARNTICNYPLHHQIQLMGVVSNYILSIGVENLKRLPWDYWIGEFFDTNKL